MTPADPYPTEEQVREALALARARLERASSPSEPFRGALRTRLLAVQTVSTVPASAPDRAPPPARRVRPRTALLAGALSLAVGLAGATVAADRSLPGEPLYGAKRAAEALRLRTADGPLETGLAHLHLAEERLREVRALAAGRDAVSLGGGAGPLAAGSTALGRAGAVSEALTAMDEQTRTGSGLVLGVARDTGDATPLRVLVAWSDQQTALLREVAPELPGSARDRARSSLQVLTAVGTDASALLGPRH